eukprot:m51a1_g10144 hypothetical protein (753) ;mRNA; f:69648-72276
MERPALAAPLLLLLLLLACPAGAQEGLPPRSGGACLFESGNTATSAPTGRSPAALTASWFFRVDVPWVQSYPALSYVDALGQRAIAFGAQHRPWVLVGHDKEAATRAVSDGHFRPGTGEWYHAAFTWNSSDGYAAIYENGQLVGSGHQYKGLVLPAGGRFVFPAEVWDERLFGHADEVTVWGVALSASEVAAVSRGSESVRPASRLLHWSCDDIDAAGAIADDASGVPATVAHTSGSLKVPSTLLMGVDSNMSVVVVRPDAETLLGLPVGTRVLSLPARGRLWADGVDVRAGDVLAVRASYVPDEDGGMRGPVAFATSFAGAVVLVPNTPPAPSSFQTPVVEGSSVAVHAAYYTADIDAPPANLTSIDAQGDRLAAYVTRLPRTGRVLQYSGRGAGDVIRTAPAALTDPGLRFVYEPGEDTADSVDAVQLVVGDALANSTPVERSFRVLPTLRPPTPQNTSALTGTGRVARVVLPVKYNYKSEGRLLATLPRDGRLTDPATGRPLASLSSVRLYQWAAEVAGYSSKWDDEHGPGRVLGQIDAYPAYGSVPGTWSFNRSDPAVLEFIHVRYPTPVVVAGVATYEVRDVDSVVKIEQLSADGLSWEVLFTRQRRNASSPLSAARRALAFSPALAPGRSRHAVRDIRVWFGYSRNEWPLVDAIKLVGDVNVSVAVLPPGDAVLYTASSRPSAHEDEFDVYSALTPAIGQRVGELFATPPPARVRVLICAIDGAATAPPLVAVTLAAVALALGLAH